MDRKDIKTREIEREKERNKDGQKGYKDKGNRKREIKMDRKDRKTREIERKKERQKGRQKE